MTRPTDIAAPDAVPERDHSSGGGFIAAHESGVFCVQGCPHADMESGRTFSSARDALAAGFRPCRVCRPLHAAEPDPGWVQPLLQDFEAEPARRWHDQDLAGRDLEPAAVRRWFVTHYGLTFHAWCRLRRLGRTLGRIQSGAGVSEAVADNGYESESDFREAFALFFGQPPNAVDRESCIWIDRVRTPLGSMIMGTGDQGLYLLEFAEQRLLDTRLRPLREALGRVFLPGDHALMPQVRRELDAYFEGRLRDFKLPLQVSGTAFQEQVWNALQAIPYGQMRSYGDVAHQVGHPEAVRAVGRATGDNRIAIIIPCHRVVGSGGALVGYGGGLWRKRYLLALEQSEAFSLA